MANIVYIATSLDGYIARKDGNIDWLLDYPNPDQSDYGFAAFMERVDGLVMGRKTFETVLGFADWPYTKPVFILSTTMKEIPEHLAAEAELIQGDLAEILAHLRQRGIQNIYVDGGKTIQSFLKQDLVDEMVITRVPIVLGTGVPLFMEMPDVLTFNHAETEVFANGLVKSRYLRKR